MSEEEKQGIATFGFSIIGDMVSARLDPGEQVRLIREKSRCKWQIPILIQNPCQQKHLRIRQYRQGDGRIESLYPDDRNDKGYL